MSIRIEGEIIGRRGRMAQIKLIDGLTVALPMSGDIRSQIMIEIRCREARNNF